MLANDLEEAAHHVCNAVRAWRKEKRVTAAAAGAAAAASRSAALPKVLVRASAAQLQKLPPPLLCRLAWAAGHLAGDEGRRPPGERPDGRGLASAACKRDSLSLLGRLAPLLRWTSSADLGDTAWAYAKARLITDDLALRLLRSGVGWLPPNPIGLVNVLWAVATTKDLSPETLAALRALLATPAVSIVMRNLTGVEFARALWALGSLREDHPAFERISGSCAAVRPSASSTQCLANILWAAARVGRSVPSAEFHEELSRRRPLPSAELSASLWALAAMRETWSPVWACCSDAALLARSPSTQAVSTLLWAFATAGKAAPAELSGTAHQAARPKYSSRSLANALWALAHLRVPLEEEDAEAALEHRGRFNPQELSNTCWALAREPGTLLARHQFFLQMALPDVPRLEVQHLANVLWAFATVSVRRMEVLEPLMAEAAGRGGLGLQAIANIAWACATLRLRPRGLLEHLRRLLSACCSAHRDACTDEQATSLLGALWALGPHAAAEEALRSHARRLDDRGGAAGPSGDASTQRRAQHAVHDPPDGAVKIDEPRVVAALRSCVVLFKPTGWEVDSDGSSFGDRSREDGIGRKLSVLLADGASPGAVTRSARYGHGFVHRLDTPSSGLVLQATSYRGLYDLRVQRELGHMEREYVALCHGWLGGSRSVRARIRKLQGDRSEASLHGRPAQSCVKVLAHLVRDGQAFSLVVLTILSGRTHQIRCHLSYIGHPTVADSRYGTGRDLEWCARNFLHRYRVGFYDLDSRWHSPSAPLPPELLQCLGSCAAVRGAEAVELWLRGGDGGGGAAGRPWSSWSALKEEVEDVFQPLELQWMELK